jgi:hypothetical protein
VLEAVGLQARATATATTVAAATTSAAEAAARAAAAAAVASAECVSAEVSAISGQAAVKAKQLRQTVRPGSGAPSAFFTISDLSIAVLCGRAGRLTAQTGARRGQTAREQAGLRDKVLAFKNYAAGGAALPPPLPPVGLGRIVAFYYRSSTLYQIRELVRCLCF